MTMTNIFFSTTSTHARRAQNQGMPNFTGYPGNYYGSKHRILKNIAELIDDDVKTIADPFGGTGIVSWYFKWHGYNTLTNDVMRYSHLCHKVLIANNDITLTPEEIEMLLSSNSGRSDYFQRHYRRAFGIDTGLLLDNWASNIPKLDNPVKRDIAIFLPIACLRKKIKHCQIHFTSMGTISGEYPDKFIQLEKDIRNYASNILPKLVINKGSDCKVFNEDAVKLIPKIQADVLYLDTPYAGSAGNYEAAYAMLDDLVVALSGNSSQIVDLCDSRCELPPYTCFDNGVASLTGFHHLFENSLHIPYVIVSYNDTSTVSVGMLEGIADCYRNDIEVIPIEMRLPKSERKNHEILMVCR